MSEYLEEHTKLSIIREIAKKLPNGQLSYILKTVDEIWDREIKKFLRPKKKSFVTKF